MKNLNDVKPQICDTAYTLVRSNRKTIALQIKADARLIIRAPMRAKTAAIDAFVNSKRDWIIKKQLELLCSLKRYEDVSLEDGGRLPYLGGLCVVRRAAADKITCADGEIIVPERFSETEVVSWLKNEAKSFILPRVSHFSQLSGFKCRAVKITGAKTRWGSCSATNNLSFTWRLVMCPTEVIDYVVVHELCHVAHKNHSREFWRAVGEIIPDYKDRRSWLRENSAAAKLF